jgi:hypothetical protein
MIRYGKSEGKPNEKGLRIDSQVVQNKQHFILYFLFLTLVILDIVGICKRTSCFK